MVLSDPGCGKSHYVADVCRDQCTFYKPHGPWWDGYDMHPIVVIDDYYGWVSYDELLSS